MPQGTNIPNPMPNGTKRVHADIDEPVFDYFFKRVFAGERGPRQAFICTFFQKFHEACLSAGINPKSWDETGENEANVYRVLQQLNFTDLDEYAAEQYRLGHAAGSVAAQSEPRRPRTRRTPRASVESETQSSSAGHVGGAVGGIGQEVTDAQSVGTNPLVENQSRE